MAARIAIIKSLRPTILPGHSDMGGSPLCAYRAKSGGVDELAGLGLRRGGGFGEDLLGLRFVHHRVPPTGNGHVRNGVKLISLSYNIGTVHLTLSTHILFTPRA